MTVYSVGGALALGLISLKTIDPSGNLPPGGKPAVLERTSRYGV